MTLHLVSLGPGDLRYLTPDARMALEQAEVIIGYRRYLDLIAPILRPDQYRLGTELGAEMERARHALDLARSGQRVALVSSGDVGIYGMGGTLFELLAEEEWDGISPEVVVHPGISAMFAAAARLGAPLAHDFCAISLSDLLTPWHIIERRLIAAAYGDFVVALYNPRSRRRRRHLPRALDILRTERPPTTPVAIARQVTRPEERIQLTTLAEVDPNSVDMFTLLIIGNSQSRIVADRMATPRGYLLVEHDPPQTILPCRETRSLDMVYPLMLNLSNIPVLIVGGGRVATRKATHLLASGARIRLVSPTLTPELEAWVQEGRIEWHARSYRVGDLAGMRLVFAATDDRATNITVAREAAMRGILCNVANPPEAGSFYVPAIVRTEASIIAIGTGGRAPTKAAAMRRALAAWLDQQKEEQPS